jgi:RND family efflux transporter MFP subunit
MADDPLRLLIRSLNQFGDAAGALVSDGELLDRFVRQRDQAAFELLLWRHGPMILGVCRRLLADPHDADDAFQTTFLVLVRKAASIRRGETLGGWLYQVAHRVCLRLGAARARRAAREHPGVETLATRAVPSQELDGVLDEEIQRLPARQRVAFILCCLEGKTGDEAAHLLGCPPGTVSSRLARARERLRSRLRRRGIIVPAGIALAGAAEASGAALPPHLLTRTLAGAASLAAGQAADGIVSANILSHVEGVLRAMWFTKVKYAVCAVLLLGALLTGGIFAGQALLAQQSGDERPQDGTQAVAPGAGKPKNPAPVLVTVAKPEPGPLPLRVGGLCRAVAFERADIAARIDGVIKSMRADIGMSVRKGELLAELDAPQLALDDDLAKNAVQQAENLVAEADAGIAIARAEVETAKSLLPVASAECASAKAAADEAGNRFARDKELFAKHGVSEAELSASRAAMDKFRADAQSKEAAIVVAKAEVTVRESKLVRTQATRRAAQGKVEAAKISLAKTQLALDRLNVRAPIDGIVTMRRYGVGDSVHSQDGGPSILFTVERIDPVRVVINVGARHAGAIAVGAGVELAFDDARTRFNGQKVARTGFAIDPTNGTMRVEVDVANPQQKLRPGMAGNAAIVLPSVSPNKNVLRIPAEGLLVTRRKGPAGENVDYFTYIVRGGKAQYVPVEVGEQDSEQAEIVRGVQPEDLIVTNPQALKGAAVPVEVKIGPAAK